MLLRLRCCLSRSILAATDKGHRHGTDPSPVPGTRTAQHQSRLFLEIVSQPNNSEFQGLFKTGQREILQLSLTEQVHSEPPLTRFPVVTGGTEETSPNALLENLPAWQRAGPAC